MQQTNTALAPNDAQPLDTELRRTSLPFAGFYESSHSHNLDGELEEMFSDSNGDGFINLTHIAYRDCRWSEVHWAYAKAYATQLADNCEIEGMQFHKLVSPRFYNYSIDEIDVLLPLPELRRMLAHVDDAALRSKVRDRLTARSGFIPFYSNDLDDWGDVATWEGPQLAILVETYCDEYEDREARDCFLMEDYSGNGYLTHWIEEAIPSIDRLYELRDYLETRRNRKGALA